MWTKQPWQIWEDATKRTDWLERYRGDDDTTIGVLSNFIATHCDPKEFIHFCVDQAREEREDFIRAENSVDCVPEPEEDYPEGPWDYETDGWDDEEE